MDATKSFFRNSHCRMFYISVFNLSHIVETTPFFANHQLIGGTPLIWPSISSTRFINMQKIVICYSVVYRRADTLLDNSVPLYKAPKFAILPFSSTPGRSPPAALPARCCPLPGYPPLTMPTAAFCPVTLYPLRPLLPSTRSPIARSVRYRIQPVSLCLLRPLSPSAGHP